MATSPQAVRSASTFCLHRLCCKYGTLADDLGPPLSQEAALSRFSGAATLVASPLSPFWLEETVYGTAEADALCALFGTERLHVLVNLDRGSVRSIAICHDDVAFLQRLAHVIASTSLRSFPGRNRAWPSESSSESDGDSHASQDYDSDASADACVEFHNLSPEKQRALLGKTSEKPPTCELEAELAHGSVQVESSHDPADVEGWVSFEGFSIHMGPKIRLSVAEACFRGLPVMIRSLEFPYRVRSTRFGSAECRAWCLEVRAKTGGLSAILGLDRAYPTWIAIYGRSDGKPLTHQGMCDYIFRQEGTQRHLEDERVWIDRRVGGAEMSAYVRRWWPAS